VRAASQSTPTGHTIFCDDIRREITGKASLIGMYWSVMFLNAPAFPVIIPKLALRVTYFERPGESDEPVELRVYFPGDEETPVYKMDMNFERASIQLPSAPIPGAEFLLLSALRDVEFCPAVIAQEGLIKVRAYRGDLEIRLGSLNVRLNPLSSQQVPPI